MRPAVFLDRDGVLNRAFVRAGVPHPPATLAEFELLPGVPAALELLRQHGFAPVVVTNQPDVARGTQTRAIVEAINARLRAEVSLDDLLVCYHDTPDGCDCRKPRPGMLLQAATRHALDLRRSFMVGDRWSDIVAGQAAGCTTILIDMPYSGRERCAPDHIAADLPEAARLIVALATREE
jgi:D-glycero-D-manno-heptose 1,7-bisphosphate phosphatase